MKHKELDSSELTMATEVLERVQSCLIWTDDSTRVIDDGNFMISFSKKDYLVLCQAIRNLNTVD